MYTKMRIAGSIVQDVKQMLHKWKNIATKNTWLSIFLLFHWIDIGPCQKAIFSSVGFASRFLFLSQDTITMELEWATLFDKQTKKGYTLP